MSYMELTAYSLITLWVMLSRKFFLLNIILLPLLVYSCAGVEQKPKSEEEALERYDIKKVDNGFDKIYYTLELHYYNVIPNSDLEGMLILKKTKSRPLITAHIKFFYNNIFDEQRDFGVLLPNANILIGEKKYSFTIDGIKKRQESQLSVGSTINDKSYSWIADFTLNEAMVKNILDSNAVKLRFIIGKDSAVLEPSKSGFQSIKKLSSL